jgi:hypothetical protein
MTMPAWMYGEVAPHGAPAHHPTQPPFIPGYRRVNMHTGEEGEEFFTTVNGDPGGPGSNSNPFENPYGGFDPSQYQPEGFDPNEDPFANPYGGMDPSMFSDPGMEALQDPFSDPYGGMDPGGYAPEGFGPNEDPFSNPYGSADPSSMYGETLTVAAIPTPTAAPTVAAWTPRCKEDPGNFLGGGYPDGHLSNSPIPFPSRLRAAFLLVKFSNQSTLNPFLSRRIQNDFKLENPTRCPVRHTAVG